MNVFEFGVPVDVQMQQQLQVARGEAYHAGVDDLPFP